MKYTKYNIQVNRLINVSRTNHFKRRIETAAGDWKQRWRIANELLHSRDTDKTRTDTEKSHLSKSFADYFTSKISRLREAAVATLRSTPPDLLSALPDPPHVGCTIHSLPYVTAHEVSKLLHKSPQKSSSIDTIPPPFFSSVMNHFLS